MGTVKRGLFGLILFNVDAEQHRGEEREILMQYLITGDKENQAEE